MTPFIKHYTGFSFRTNGPINIFVYPKDTLQRVCADGQSYEKHLQYELKVHETLLRRGGNELIVPTLAIYERRIGLEAADKELFVLREQINNEQFISLTELINRDGGLLRIPFLTKTGAVVYLAK